MSELPSEFESRRTSFSEVFSFAVRFVNMAVDANEKNGGIYTKTAMLYAGIATECAVHCCIDFLQNEAPKDSPEAAFLKLTDARRAPTETKFEIFSRLYFGRFPENIYIQRVREVIGIRNRLAHQNLDRFQSYRLGNCIYDEEQADLVTTPPKDLKEKLRAAHYPHSNIPRRTDWWSPLNAKNAVLILNDYLNSMFVGPGQSYVSDPATRHTIELIFSSTMGGHRVIDQDSYLPIMETLIAWDIDTPFWVISRSSLPKRQLGALE